MPACRGVIPPLLHTCQTRHRLHGAFTPLRLRAEKFIYSTLLVYSAALQIGLNRIDQSIFVNEFATRQRERYKNTFSS